MMSTGLVLDHSDTSDDVTCSVKLTYQAPTLTPLLPQNIQNNEGFASDAGLSVGGS